MMTAREAQSQGRNPAPAGGREATASEAPRLLFAYGTLAPSDRAAAMSGGWVADAVRGRLFDLGPYPALVELDEPGARWVEGFVREVTERELTERLDPYEAVSEGLYDRATTTTRAGQHVWVYVYARELPTDARELLRSWHDRE